jgi:glycine oxidase
LRVKSWDAIIIGGGIIGVSLALSLRKEGLRVLIVERGEPGREASHAAAGMLAGSGAEIPSALRVLAKESARMYPEFVHELEDESGMKIDLREEGTILVSGEGEFPDGAEVLSAGELKSLEPAVAIQGMRQGGRARPLAQSEDEYYAAYVNERSVDPRTLMVAALKAAKHREIDISSGSEVRGVVVENRRAAGVKTEKTFYASEIVVNCAGAWAGQIPPYQFPVRPVKVQMLAVTGGPRLKHVIRGDKAYLVPRSDGKIVIGSTLEDAGFNKQVDVDTIEKLLKATIETVPELARARQHEAWAGLRPGTPDELPIVGETSTPGYFLATGHYRDGILLAPATAKAVGELIAQRECSYDLAAFRPSRFPESAK